MRNKFFYIGAVILFLIAIGIGFLIGKLFTIPGITCSKEINPLHGISILSSVFIAVFVAILLDKHKESKKMQRDLFFKRIDDILEYINHLDATIGEDEIAYVVVTSRLKKIMMSCDLLKKVLDLLHTNDDGFLQKFEQQHKDLNQLMTMTPAKPNVGKKSPIKCVKGILKYETSRMQEIESRIQTMKNAIFELQIFIASK